jgi:hypothetical protein
MNTRSDHRVNNMVDIGTMAGLDFQILIWIVAHDMTFLEWSREREAEAERSSFCPGAWLPAI